MAEISQSSRMFRSILENRWLRGRDMNNSFVLIPEESGPVRNLLGALLVLAGVVLLLWGNEMWARNQEAGYQLRRCVITEQALDTGHRITDGDIRQGFCRRQGREEFPETKVRTIGKYLVVGAPAEAALSGRNLQSEPLRISGGSMIVFVNVTDGRAQCLKHGDRLLFIRTQKEEGEAEIFPDFKGRSQNGLEVLQVWPQDSQSEASRMVALRVPSELLDQAALLSLKEWSPIVLGSEAWGCDPPKIASSADSPDT
jgi:hypothetical protein